MTGFGTGAVFGTGGSMFGTPTTSAGGFGSFGSTNTGGFGATATTGFGTAPATGFGSTTTGGFGTPSFGNTGGVSFGNTAATGFGTTATTTASGLGTLGTSGGSFTFGLPATTSAPSIGLGTSSGGGFSLTPAATTTTSGFSFGLSTPANKPGFSLTPTKPSLGGTTQLAKPDLGGEATLPVSFKSVKESPVPPELSKLVEDLGAVIKKTKAEWAGPGAGGLRPALGRTAEDAEAVRGALLRAERGAAGNARDAARSRKDITRLAAGCDTAQRTRDLPPGVQPDNAGPLAYFIALAESFQERVVRLRVEVESTERHMQSALNPVAPQPQDLRDSLRRLHECFVSLAGRMQLAHSAMQELKQAHLNLRRARTGDYSDIFGRKTTKEGLSGNLTSLTLDSLYSSAAAVVRAGGDAPPLATSALLPQPQPAAQTPLLATSPLTATGSKRGKR